MDTAIAIEWTEIDWDCIGPTPEQGEQILVTDGNFYWLSHYHGCDFYPDGQKDHFEENSISHWARLISPDRKWKITRRN